MISPRIGCQTAWTDPGYERIRLNDNSRHCPFVGFVERTKSGRNGIWPASHRHLPRKDPSGEAWRHAYRRFRMLFLVRCDSVQLLRLWQNLLNQAERARFLHPNTDAR